MTRLLVLLLLLLAAGGVAVAAWRGTSSGAAPGVGLDYAARPMRVIVDADRLAAALASSPHVASGGEGAEIWVIGKRGCDACEQYLRADLGELEAAGADVRAAFFAPENASDDEAATLAELGARRSWSLFRSWINADAGDFYARNSFVAPTDPIRKAILDAGRRTRDEVEAVMAANGLTVIYPIFFWRTDGGAGGGDWMVVTGDTARAREALRAVAVAEVGGG